jgi:sugar phosphate isomerase/epimerase
MKSNRRTFIKTGALAFAGTAVLNNSLFAAPGQKGITGLQLYSIRDDMSRDPFGSLTKLTETGYEYLEHASYTDRKFYGYPATEFKKILDNLGLRMISGHTEMGRQHWDEARKDFSESWKFTLEDAAILGQKYVVSPWINEDIRKNYDDFRAFLDVFNKCGELCKKQGMKFGYHNHNFEFSEKLNGETLFDIMMKNINPDLVVVQLDIGNLFDGGAVALDVINQYPGRFENVHVKDVKKTGRDGKYESTIIGEGVADVRKVIALIKSTGGAEVMIIEQESYQEKTPMECTRINLEIMKKWGY